MKSFRQFVLTISILFLLCINSHSSPIPANETIQFTVSMPDPSSHIFHVRMRCTGLKAARIDFKMPAWTPGYYQILNFGKNVSDLKVSTPAGDALQWTKVGDTSWTINVNREPTVVLEYNVLTTRAFVATPYLDTSRAYILPGGVFLYPEGSLGKPAAVTIVPFATWKNIATGLTADKTDKNVFHAENFDVLYDSPILVGNLEELPPFTVKGIKHRFIGYKLGDFDKVKFMGDLQKIVQQATDMMGDIPYKEYTFIAIGPGPGGIEHINSTTVGFNGKALATPQGQLQVYSFLAHEYFHHFNVKRIRPIELGPFEYEKPNRTDLLWLSEGGTVYYEYLLVRRAGLCSEEELFSNLRSSLLGFESNNGRLFQTLQEASLETWSDGPFGRKEEDEQKTISIYEKGAAFTWLLDLNIRHVTGNKKSLDDVMRRLYNYYYKERKRGFTTAEFKTTCESISGTNLDSIFQYLSTTQEMNYRMYLGYGGLQMDSTAKSLPGGWFGATAMFRNDSCFVSRVEQQSPAWKAGIRRGFFIANVDGKKPTKELMGNVLAGRKPEEIYSIVFNDGEELKSVNLVLGEKKERPFIISRIPNPAPLEKSILDNWIRN